MGSATWPGWSQTIPSSPGSGRASGGPSSPPMCRSRSGRWADRGGSSRLGRGRGHEVRQERRPAAAVPVPLLLPAQSQPLPAAMLDLDPCPRCPRVDEPDLDLRRVRAIATEMPQIAQARRRLPDRDLAPVVLLAGLGALEDPAAGPALEHDVRRRIARRGVIGRPPGVDAGGPHLEGVVGRAVDVEREPDGLDHRPRVAGDVLEAMSANRAPASPQTRSRYVRTARIPSSWSR